MRFVDAIINIVFGHTKSCFASCLVLFFLLAPGLLSLTERYDIKVWFKQSHPDRIGFEQFQRHFGSDDSIVMALHSKGGVFDAETVKIIKEMTDSLWRLPKVVRVDSLANYSYVKVEGDDIAIEPFLEEFDSLTGEGQRQYLELKRNIALGHHVLPGYLINASADTTLLFARLTPAFGEASIYQESLEAAQKIAQKYRQNGDHQVYVSGYTAAETSLKNIAQQENKMILSACLILIFLYLMLTFRSFVSSLFPFAITVMSVAMTFGVCHYLGFQFSQTLQLLPGIIIAISIADSVHVLISYYQYRSEGQEKRQALEASLRKNILPGMATTVSTWAGLLSFSFSDMIPIRNLGILGGIGCLIAWVLTIFMMCPALLWVNLKIPKHFTKRLNASSKEEGIAQRMSSWINRYKKSILFVSTMVAICSIFFAAKNEINTNLYLFFKKGNPIRTSQEFIKKHFGGSTGPELIIRSKRADGIKEPDFLFKVEKLKRWLSEQPYVTKTIDIVDNIKEMNKNFHEGREEFYKIPKNKKTISEFLLLYTMSLPQGMDLNHQMTLNFDSMRMSVLWDIDDSKEWIKHTGLIERQAKRLGLDVTVTGKQNVAKRLPFLIIPTFIVSSATALCFITLLMILVLRSVKFGLLSMLTNFFPLIFGGALMYLTGIGLSLGTVMVAAICLGIVVDDTVYIFIGYCRAKRDGLSTQQALAHTFCYTGVGLIVTTLILTMGLGIYMFSDFLPNAHFGFSCSVILLAALVVDLLVLPALLLVLDSLHHRS